MMSNFISKIVELSRGKYRTLGVSVPVAVVRSIGLRKGDKVEINIEKKTEKP